MLFCVSSSFMSSHVDPGLSICLSIWGVPGLSGNFSLSEGKTPIVINRGL